MDSSSSTRRRTQRSGPRPTASTRTTPRPSTGRSTRSPGASGRSTRPTLGVLGDVSGLDVVELGCGTAYFSAWLARRGARPVGVDITPAQLETARRLMAETGIEFPLVEADAGDDRTAVRELRPRRCPSTARRSGSIRIAGSPRRRVCSGRAAGSSSSATRRSSSSARPTTSRQARSCSVPSSGCAGSSGPRAASSFTSPTASGSTSSARTASSSSGCSSCRPRRTPKTHEYYALRDGRVGAQVAGGGDLGRAQARRMRPLVLASTSPQRRAILTQLRMPFEVGRARRSTRCPAPARSSVPQGRRGRSTAAGGRCSVWTRRCCSTARLLGKPADAAEAREMLRRSPGVRTRSSPVSACGRPTGRSSRP